jgi:hypothetical protein
MSFLFNNKVELSNLDAFGRTRISETFTIADYSHVYGENSEMLFENTGTGTYSYLVDKASIELSVGTPSGDTSIIQSRMYHHYLPGKSQLIYVSFNLDGTSINCNKEVGYFDDRNGIILRLGGNGELVFVQRSYVTGTPVDTIYPQSNWNVDRCDGTGRSQFNLDITKTQLMFIDYQWLGVGTIRCGFVHDGNKILSHEIHHSNIELFPYWSNPSLPIRSQITNTGIGSGTASLIQICGTVISEGGHNLSGYDNAGYTSLNITNSGESKLAWAMRLKQTFKGSPNRATVIPSDYKIFSKFSNIRFEIWKLPESGTIGGGSWTFSNNSVVEYNTTSTTYSINGGDLVGVGFVSASLTGGKGVDISFNGSTLQISGSPNKMNFLSSNIGSTDSNVMALIITPLDGATASINMGVTWREIY